MKRKFRTYLICALFVVGFIACGEDSTDDADKQPAQPSVQPSTSTKDSEAIQITVDFAAEEEAIKEAFTLHGEAIGTEDPNEFMAYWLRSESEEVFVTWVFWAGKLETHRGWQEIKKGWEGIFNIRKGKMTVEISSVAINKTGKRASLRGSYRWAVNGQLIALMVKDREEGWQIKQVDYTGEKFGKQVEELENPAYVNPPPEDD